MLDESKKEILEGKEEEKVGEDLDETSTSEVSKNEEKAEENENVSLDNSPVPTEEQQEEANLIPSPDEVPAESQPIEDPVVDEEVGVEEHRPEDPIPQPEAPAPIEENGVTEAPIRTFTQSQVDDIAGKTRLETREKTFRYIYDRYGVNSEEELDELIGNAQRYDSLKEEFDTERAGWKKSENDHNQELVEVKEKLALMESGIDKDRYEDAKLILKGKGLDVTQENIVNELATHPEWKKSDGAKVGNPGFIKTGEGSLEQEPSEPVSKISVLGNEPRDNISPEQMEEDYALNKLFK